MNSFKSKNRRKVSKGKIFDAYFEQVNSLENVEIEKKRPFGGGTYTESVDSFICNGKRYAVQGFSHFNAHISGFTDKSSIYSITVEELY